MRSLLRLRGRKRGGGTGSVEVTLTYPTAAGVTAVTATLKNLTDGTAQCTADETLAITSGTDTNSVTFSRADVPAGVYLLVFTLTTEKNDITTTTTSTELVRVANGAKSESALTITTENLNEIVTLTFKNADGTDFGDWKSGYTPTLTYENYATVTLPTANDVSRTGYEFKGWYTASDLATSAGESIVLAADTTLYAKWEEFEITLKTGNAINAILAKFSTATAFKRSDDAPSDTATLEYYLDTAGKYVPVWIDGTTLYYYVNSEGYLSRKKLYLNEDSSYMFSERSALETIDTKDFDTSRVTNMQKMFYKCTALENLDVSKFDTANVTNMGSMFSNCGKLTSLDVSGFETAKVTNMGAMFYDCYALTSLDVRGFNTSSVTSMSGMFYFCEMLTSLDVSNFDTSNVTNMGNMFGGCKNVTSLDVSKFNTAKVTNMQSTFYACKLLTTVDVSKFDTSSVTDMHDMFMNSSKLTNVDVSNFNTSNVTTMWRMFDGCSALETLDVSKFDTAKVKNMADMFRSCTKLATIYASASFTTAAVTESTDMFTGCSKLKGGNGTAYSSSNTGVTYARIDGLDGNPGYFTAKAVFSSSNYDSATELADAIKTATGDVTVTLSGNVGNDVKSVLDALRDARDVTTLTLDLSSMEITSFDNETKNALANSNKPIALVLPSQFTVIAGGQFQNCHSLKSITIPASVKQIGNGAFTGCDSLEEALFVDSGGVWNAGTHTGITVTDPAANATNLTSTYVHDGWAWQSTTTP